MFLDILNPKTFALKKVLPVNFSRNLTTTFIDTFWVERTFKKIINKKPIVEWGILVHKKDHFRILLKLTGKIGIILSILFLVQFSMFIAKN